MLPGNGALHATIEEFATESCTHIECYCPRCRATRLGPICWLPRIAIGLTIAQLSTRLWRSRLPQSSSWHQTLDNSRRM